jgi:hypothetical protein
MPTTEKATSSTRATKAPPVLLGGRAVPVKRFTKLWHVGSLQMADKGIQGPSQEGSGLSVSVHPEDWTSIARLGGYPTWNVQRKSNRFLDFHKLTPAHRDALQAWGIAKGYIVLKPQWELVYYDSELDDECRCLFDTEEEARREIPDWLEESNHPKITEVVHPCPTPAMMERLQFDTKFCDAMDMAATFWVEDETEMDGVWWNDVYAPETLSAPRGVIVRRALPQWTLTR